MAINEIEKRHHQTFEKLKKADTDGMEYWSARQLSKALDYSEYRHFIPVIERAKEACKNSGHDPADHFEDILDMVEELGGTMPEDLPIPDTSAKILEREQQKKLGDGEENNEPC